MAELCAFRAMAIEGKEVSMLQRLKSFLTFWDSRYEDITKDNWSTVIYRDLSAGLVTAMTAIPMAMGFAMASGLRPEQGLIAGSMACVVGRAFGGSKYQVYGPTAAFIPLIAMAMSKYDHGFLVLASVISGIILCALGLAGLGKIGRVVPNSIVVGFTVGIGITIAATYLYDVFGMKAGTDKNLIFKVGDILSRLGEASPYALALGLLVFIVTRVFQRISIYIPGLLLTVGLGTLIAATAWSGHGLENIQSKFGVIPTNFFKFTPPSLPVITPSMLMDLSYFIIGIVFVSGVESLLCSAMADKLAGNRKTLFDPDREFWGQGLVQIIVPMINGFPCTGALARTATSIKAGAVTPLAGYFKAAAKLGMVVFMTQWLELVPLACIGGVMLWVASNMIKVPEIKRVLAGNRFHAFLMVYTAILVPLTDFLTGVLSALVIYMLLRRFFEAPGLALGTTPELVVAAQPNVGEEVAA